MNEIAMNVPRLLQLAELIRNTPHLLQATIADDPETLEHRRNFSMLHWNDEYEMEDPDPEHPCGTVCCIGGTANAMFGGDRFSTFSNARDQLGLDGDTASQLFYMNADGDWWPEVQEAARLVTPDQAADVIEHLALTGKVDWARVGVVVPRD